MQPRCIALCGLPAVVSSDGRGTLQAVANRRCEGTQQIDRAASGGVRLEAPAGIQSDIDMRSVADAAKL